MYSCMHNTAPILCAFSARKVELSHVPGSIIHLLSSHCCTSHYFAAEIAEMPDSSSKFFTLSNSFYNIKKNSHTFIIICITWFLLFLTTMTPKFLASFVPLFTKCHQSQLFSATTTIQYQILGAKYHHLYALLLHIWFIMLASNRWRKRIFSQDMRLQKTKFKHFYRAMHYSA